MDPERIMKISETLTNWQDMQEVIAETKKQQELNKSRASTSTTSVKPMTCDYQYAEPEKNPKAIDVDEIVKKMFDPKTGYNFLKNA